MSNKTKRQTQHKSSREDRKQKDIQDLKSENRLLRKQLSRLRKEVQKSGPVESTEEEDNLEIEDTRPKCIKCDSFNLKSLKMPSGTLLTVCKECGHRQTSK